MNVWNKKIIHGIISLLFILVPIVGFFATETSFAAGECKVSSKANPPVWLSPYTEIGKLAQDGWYRDTASGRPEVTINIETENCAGKEIKVSLTGFVLIHTIGIYDITGGVLSEGLSANVKVAVLTDVPFTVPSSEKFEIKLRAGEEKCLSPVAVANVADCMYHVEVATPFSWSIDSLFDYESRDKKWGNLDYECDGTGCQGADWTYVSDTSASPKDPEKMNKDLSYPTGQEIVLEDGNIGDPTSACIDTTSGELIEGCYELYEGFSDALGGKLKTITDANNLGELINAIIAFVIGIAGVVTVAMIFYEGFLYMKSKEDGNPAKLGAIKERIFKTVIGFILLLSIYVILRTINPDLLNLTPRMDSVWFKTGGDAPITAVEESAGYTSFKSFVDSQGIVCPESGGVSQISSIANSFIGKVTYSQEDRYKFCSQNTYCLDCSSFVSTVYKCAGLPSPGGFTGKIFSGAETVDKNTFTQTSVNGKDLKPGDLLGWVSKSFGGSGSESSGHVIMYIGGGKAIESTSGNKGRLPGKAIQVKSVTTYGKRIKFIKRI